MLEWGNNEIFVVAVMPAYSTHSIPKGMTIQNKEGFCINFLPQYLPDPAPGEVRVEQRQQGGGSGRHLGIVVCKYQEDSDRIVP